MFLKSEIDSWLKEGRRKTAAEIQAEAEHCKKGWIKMNEGKKLNSTDLSLEGWIDGQKVMQLLHISKRTLQTFRNNGTIPYSHIGKRNFYYRHDDILKILSDNYTLTKIRKYDNKRRNS
ncbi:helix-turn-helix domain-containing protein [Bacteroidales bacterium OttesenSCG-928-B11]|nr:helix-turn-helix domain-containing protein [Bacteroidales bacterium OttesenSCG-928-E04]MDL2311903.1 helix-turn-helix domain-containing protein [Bacteroidales bacterium OttesenSCG-928-B11]